jgi:hypothetical protein
MRRAYRPYVALPAEGCFNLMMAPKRHINPALDDALKQMGRPTTPEDLSRRGVKKLRAVGMREVSLLIERAVNRTLIGRTESVSQDELEVMVKAAQTEFSQQLQGLQDLADSRELIERHKLEWRKSLDSLREAVAQRRRFLEQEERAPSTDWLQRHARLRSDLIELLGPLLSREYPAAGGAASTRRVAEELVERVLPRFAAERDELRREHDAQLAQLERRLDKLVTSLTQTELALERAALARAADLGIESIYRNVQGLVPSERAREFKAALMSSIFEANVELRSLRAIAAQRSSADSKVG